MLRFIIGLVTGAAIGVAASQASQGQSGADLRAEFDRIRNDLQQRDFDALGTHLEDRFKELQANLEVRFAEVEEAAEATEEPAAEAQETAEAAEETEEPAAEAQETEEA